MGNAHNISAYFVKTDDNKWRVCQRDAAAVSAASWVQYQRQLVSVNNGQAGEFSMTIR